MSWKRRTGWGAALVLILPVLLVILLLTPPGTRMLLNTADSMLTPLSIDYQKGSLYTELHLQSVRWQQPGTEVSVSGLRFDLGWACLLKLAACAEYLSAENIEVKLASQPDAKAEQQEIDQLITMPIPITLSRVDIGSITLHLPEKQKLQITALQSELTFFQKLEVEKLHVKRVSFTTPPVKAAEQSTGSVYDQLANFTYSGLRTPKVFIPIDVTLKGVDVKEIAIQGEEDQYITKLKLSASAAEHKVLLNSLALQYQQLNITASGKFSLAKQYPLSLALDVKGKLEQQPLAVALKTSGSLADLKLELDVKADSKVKDQLQGALSLNGRADLVSNHLPITVDLRWQDVNIPAAGQSLKSKLGEMSLSGDLQHYVLQMQTSLVAKDIPDTNFELAVSGAPSEWEVQYLKARLLEGTVVTTGTLSFGEGMHWQGAVELTDINPAAQWPQYQATLSGSFEQTVKHSADKWEVTVPTLDISGDWRDFPLVLLGKGRYTEGRGAEVDFLKFKNADNALELKGSMAADKQLNARADIQFKDISQTIPQIQGQMSGTATLGGSLTHPDVVFAFLGKNLSAFKVSLDEIDGQGNVNWQGNQTLALDVKLNNLRTLDYVIDEAEASLNGTLDDHTLAVKATSDLAVYKGDVSGSLQGNSWQGTWLNAKGEFEHHTVALTEEVSLLADWQGQSYKIGSHCWQSVMRSTQRAGTLCISRGEFIEGQATWRAKIQDFPFISMLRPYVNQLYYLSEGLLLNARTTGQWSKDTGPDGSLEATVYYDKTFAVAEDENVVPITSAEFAVRLQQDNIDLNARLAGINLGSVSAQLQLLPQADQYGLEGELSIEKINLHAFKNMVPSVKNLEGMLQGSATVGGVLQQPTLDGQLTLSNGEFAAAGVPVELRDLQQTILLKTDSAEFQGDFLLGQGRGKLDGELAWSPQLEGEVHFSGDRLSFDYRNTVKAEVSPDLKLTFSPQKLALNGEVNVPYARVQVRELPPNAISPSDDVVLVEAEPQEDRAKIDMNVTINIDKAGTGEVKVDALGLTANVRGNMDVYQADKSLQANGEINLLQGRYKAYGQNLLIREGQVLFNGPVDRPYLSIEAIRDPEVTADDVTAGIRVSGSAKQPSVEVFSEPPMDQPDALSYLLRGQSMSGNSTGADEAMLANLLLSYSLSKSENTVGKVGRTFGVEDLALTASGSGDETQLQVSGYLAPGVQIRYGVGLDSTAEVALRYQVWQKMYVEAVSGVDSTLDLFYSFSLGDKNKKQPE